MVKEMKINPDFYFYRGRDALSLALFSIGLKKNEKVLIQAFTCLAVLKLYYL